MNATKKGAEWIKRGELAALFGVSPVTIRSWCDKGLLPYHMTPTGIRRYKTAEIAEVYKRFKEIR